MPKLPAEEPPANDATQLLPEMFTICITPLTASAAMCQFFKHHEILQQKPRYCSPPTAPPIVAPPAAIDALHDATVPVDEILMMNQAQVPPAGRTAATPTPEVIEVKLPTPADDVGKGGATMVDRAAAASAAVNSAAPVAVAPIALRAAAWLENS
jgi:hypothetical protein